MSKVIHNPTDIYDAMKERKNEIGVIWRTIAEKAGLGTNTINKWRMGLGMRLDTVLAALDVMGLEMVIRKKTGK